MIIKRSFEKTLATFLVYDQSRSELIIQSLVRFLENKTDNISQTFQQMIRNLYASDCGQYYREYQHDEDFEPTYNLQIFFMVLTNPFVYNSTKEVYDSIPPGQFTLKLLIECLYSIVSDLINHCTTTNDQSLLSEHLVSPDFAEFFRSLLEGLSEHQSIHSGILNRVI